MLVKPEEVGLSSARLGRISEHLRRYIDAGKLAGTLTLVARQGKIAYCEPQGHLEIERQRAVAPDSVFRIYSMTKPIASVGLMMLWEQGRSSSTIPCTSSFHRGAISASSSAATIRHGRRRPSSGR